jgi:hypothetical protein
MKKIKGVFVDTTNNTIQKYVLNCETYKDICALLDCEYCTCVSRRVGGVIVDIYCDDEALIRDIECIPAVITRHNNEICEVIYNKCFICSHTSKGEMLSLRSKQIDAVLKATTVISHPKKINCVLASL